MTVRTTKKTVTFLSPFSLGGFEEVLPPGTYIVETGGDLPEGVSFGAYHKPQTFLRLPTRPGQRGLSRTLTIDPDELHAALKRDEASSAASAKGAPVRKPSGGTPNLHEAETDRQAVERAEDEGMTVHPS